MIDFVKLNGNELQDLQLIISKNVEKSELERHYLFTNDIEEKSLIYIWCYRFLYTIHNLTKESGLKDELKKELDLNREIYIKAQDFLYKIKNSNFNKHRVLNKLRILFLENKETDDLIDSFAVLLEKTNVLSMARLKGIVLEGDSAKEYKKIFDADVSKIKESQIDFSEHDNIEENIEKTQEELEAERENKEEEQFESTLKEKEDKDDFSDFLPPRL